MPRGDGTGPKGQGPRSGKARDGCKGEKRGPGSGHGQGQGQGQGSGNNKNSSQKGRLRGDKA